MGTQKTAALIIQSMVLRRNCHLSTASTNYFSHSIDMQDKGNYRPGKNERISCPLYCLRRMNTVQEKKHVFTVMIHEDVPSLYFTGFILRHRCDCERYSDCPDTIINLLNYQFANMGLLHSIAKHSSPRYFLSVLFKLNFGSQNRERERERTLSNNAYLAFFL